MVVPRARLEEETMALATRIAESDRFTLRMVKWAVNSAQDAMGFGQTLEAAFAMHHLLHTHFQQLNDFRAVAGSDETVRQLLRERGPIAGLPVYLPT